MVLFSCLYRICDRIEVGKGLGLWIVLGFSISLSVECTSGVCGAAGNPQPSPSASVLPTSQASQGAPLPSPSPLISKSDTKALLKEFKNAQKAELKAIKHQQDFEKKELVASQKAREKEWLLKERDLRHEFFKSHTKGPERRAFVKDFLDRRRALNAMFAEEKAKREQEQNVRFKAVENEQKEKLKEFEEYLNRGERPPERLWPGPGR